MNSYIYIDMKRHDRHIYTIKRFSVLSVFENQEKIVIVMEYAAGGELYDYISRKRHLNEEETKHIFRQIVSAVRYCHKVCLHFL